LQFLQQFERRDADKGFSQSLGVVISMKDPHSPEDEQFERWLRQNAKDHCFQETIPRATALQTAAYFSVRRRSYFAKYPGQTGRVLRNVAGELLARMERSGAVESAGLAGMHATRAARSEAEHEQ
jgi:hypothetical protein